MSATSFAEARASEDFVLTIRPDAPDPLSPVTDWGFCAACDGLTNDRRGGTLRCHTCRAADLEHVREARTNPLSARYRPASITTVTESDQWTPPSGEILWRTPADSTELTQRICTLITLRVNERLDAGDSLQFAIARLALGRDDLRDELEAMHERRYDRKTIANQLDRLVSTGHLIRVGQLPAWEDPYDENGFHGPKRGAYVYAVPVELRSVGDLADAARAALLRTDPAPTALFATVRGFNSADRLTACLRWASQNAVEGCRNALGHWLAHRCIDEGLTEGQAWTRVMEPYQIEVGGLGRAYTMREARATLASAYRSQR